MARLAAVLALLALLTGCATAPRSTEPAHALAIGHFIDSRMVGWPSDNEVHVGWLLEVTVEVDIVVAGHLDKRRFTDSFATAGNSNLRGEHYFFLTQYSNDRIGLDGFNAVAQGFCLKPDGDAAAFSAAFARLSHLHPCRERHEPEEEE